jgi:hypothetical protein
VSYPLREIIAKYNFQVLAKEREIESLKMCLYDMDGKTNKSSTFM